MENLFAYGTLMDSDVQEKLFGRIVNGENDILENFEKKYISIDENVYPYVKESNFDSVQGVIFSLEPSELRITDKYEGAEYKRINKLLKSGKEAWVYILS